MPYISNKELQALLKAKESLGKIRAAGEKYRLNNRAKINARAKELRIIRKQKKNEM